MAIVRWDGLNKGTVIGPWSEVLGGQRCIWFKAGTMTIHLTLNEANNLVNGVIDCLEDAKRDGHWPPPAPNR